MKKILLTGSNGVLGTKFLELARHDYDVIATGSGSCHNANLGVFYYQTLDITDRDAVLSTVATHQPDIILHAAAYTAVDQAETERRRCQLVNVEGTANILAAAAAQKAKMVYLSTDYVFDGREGPYRETDKAHPLGWYAHTKYEGERLVRAYAGAWLICRTTVLYGLVAHRKSFADWLINQLQNGEAASVVADQFSNPTLADDMVGMLKSLIDQEKTGVYHTMGSDYLSRYEFATRLARVFALDATLIKPVATLQMGQPAPRPLKGGGLTDKLQQDTGYMPMTLDQQLALYYAQVQQAAVKRMDKNIATKQA